MNGIGQLPQPSEVKICERNFLLSHSTCPVPCLWCLPPQPSPPPHLVKLSHLVPPGARKQLPPLQLMGLEIGSHHKCSNSKPQHRQAAACPVTSGKRTEKVNPPAPPCPRGGPAQICLFCGVPRESHLAELIAPVSDGPSAKRLDLEWGWGAEGQVCL